MPLPPIKIFALSLLALVVGCTGGGSGSSSSVNRSGSGANIEESKDGGIKPGGDATGFYGAIRVAGVYLRAFDSAPISAAHFDEIAVLDSYPSVPELYLFTKAELPKIPKLGTEIPKLGKSPVSFTFEDPAKKTVSIQGESYFSLETFFGDAAFKPEYTTGVWMLGSQPVGGTSVTPLTRSSVTTYENMTGNFALYNPTDMTIGFGFSNAFAKPKSVVILPGPMGNPTVLRFTTPCAGNYSVSSLWEPANPNYVTTSVSVRADASILYHYDIGANDKPTFASEAIALGQGSHLDFVITFGNDSQGTYDSTLIDAQVFAQTACP